MLFLRGLSSQHKHVRRAAGREAGVSPGAGVPPSPPGRLAPGGLKVLSVCCGSIPPRPGRGQTVTRANWDQSEQCKPRGLALLNCPTTNPGVSFLPPRRLRGVPGAVPGVWLRRLAALQPHRLRLPRLRLVSTALTASPALARGSPWWAGSPPGARCE